MAYKRVKEIGEIAEKLKNFYGRTLERASKEQIYQACALCLRDKIMDKWTESREAIGKKGQKVVIYMSAEFLMGRALVNNMINMGVYDAYAEALEEIGIPIDEVEPVEDDAALGNGGLGRLAACFLDSLSTLNYPAIGCGIRYEHGLFRQHILNGEQIEIEDNWMDTGAVWQSGHPEEQFEIHFGGEYRENWTEDGLKIEAYNYSTVIAVPYDMPVVGYNTDAPATLRLWSARAKHNLDMTYFNRGDYTRAMQEKELAEVISKVLYPDDTHEAGRQLRLKQFYFFTSATMQYIVKRHKRRYGSLHTLPDYIQVQINDTHPTLAIPELMRILMDEEGMGWEEAEGIVRRMFNYTNHTIMREALECWPKDMFRLLLPRVYSIIETMNERYCQKLWEAFPGDFEKISSLAIMAYNEIRMANICVAMCKCVNGVSQLHGDILKQSLFRDNYVMEPEKFHAITNGVTQRRWLVKANPELTELIASKIGSGFITDYREFAKLEEYLDDDAFLEAFADIKQHNKARLAKYFAEKQNTVLMENAIYDVQAKRLHEYKRQLLKVMHILHLYNKIIADPESFKQPMVFLFAAKASAAYTRAKAIIRLINSVAELVNNDPRTKDILQVAFLENYNVSSAEILIPAGDVSEQISTAGFEASGTSNMKFMLNGAVTLGTMDGANVEICEAVGLDNIFIFGASAQEITQMKRFGTYHPAEIYEKDADLRAILNHLIDGSLKATNERQFADIYHSLLFGDYDKPDTYFLLHDFRSYDKAFNAMVDTYQDKKKWSRMALMNTIRAAKFSSDRTIEDYNKLVWGLQKFHY